LQGLREHSLKSVKKESEIQCIKILHRELPPAILL
jgi:hypothetical protein